MGASESTPTLVIRLGGIASSPAETQELIRGRGSFQARNGDWFKHVCEGQGETVRVVQARRPFDHFEPPGLDLVRFLPINADIPAEESRAAKLFPSLDARRRRQHLDIGDVVSSVDGDVAFVVTDVEPSGGGVLTGETKVHLQGSAVKLAMRVRIAPLHRRVDNTARGKCHMFLARMAGRMYIRLKQPFRDDMGLEWVVVAIDGFKQGEDGRILSSFASVSIGWLPEVEASAHCLHCYRLVSSPKPGFEAFAFACPHCRYLVANPVYSVWEESDNAPPSAARELIMRLRLALSEISAADPRTVVLESLISRLPRRMDGRLDWRALNEVASRVVSAPISNLTSTPQAVINRLPVSAYPRMDGERCEICLESYQQGVNLRTLPCFHRFHVTCCDNWLALSKLCPLCKMDVEHPQQFSD